MGQVKTKECRLKNGETAIIRTALADDAEVILEYARIILIEDLYNVLTLEEFQMTAEKEKEWIQSHYDNPAHIILIAEVNGRFAGLLGFENSGRKRLAHQGMLHMSVGPEFREKGVGTALLQTLIDWANENTIIERLILSVFANNYKAMGLYKKMGFAEEGRQKKGIKLGLGKYVDNVLMYKFVKN
jgi:RimJ/RimL family protein N-acetyltransferase